MPALPVTALYAGLLGLWVMLLAAEVGRRRVRHKVSLGSGGVDELERAIRAHGNATETVPIMLILMALAEGMGTPAAVLHAAGLAFLAGRVTHGLHFVRNHVGFTTRAAGMWLTVLPILGLSAGLVAHAVFDLAGL